MLRRLTKRLGYGMIGLTLLFTLLHLLFPLPIQDLHPPPSTVVTDVEGTILRAFLATDEMWRIRLEEDDIPAYLKQAVIGYEDRRFYYHLGVDPIGVLRALWVNVKAGAVIQGGSTITMQVARLMSPKERTLVNKVVEAFRAVQLELHFSKAEIMSHYLNMAPYGGNIVGVGAASYFYFGKNAAQLSLGEAALLAAIPNNPNRFRPDRAPHAAQQARNKVVALLAAQKRITATAAEEAMSEPIPSQRFPLPFLAPHLSATLHQQYTHAPQLETTLHAPTQRLVEQMLDDHLTPWLAEGITNGAVVVIDNSDMTVRALVGSQAFFDEAHQGQVNGALAPRSPGSALKPFVYALGIEKGLVAPQSLLYDIPVDYRGYSPVNYDRQYQGIVSVEEALIRSLNVPAVNLSAQLGPDALYLFLKKAGITTFDNPSTYYGLPLILGGAEVNLLELTALYAGLANGGRFQAPRWLAHQPEKQSDPLLEEGTAFIITNILSQVRRPELPAVWEWSVDMPSVAWKTGTSYGHRDAWSIGYTPRYTIGVWMGNFDGKGVPALVGAEVAAPLLFALFDVLERQSDKRWFSEPLSVGYRRVCTVSGMPAGLFCPTTRDEAYLPDRSPHELCTHHQRILIDNETGYRLCSHCRIGRSYREQIVGQWPTPIGTWLSKNGYAIETIPEHLPSCNHIASGDGPAIHTPQDGATYRIRSEVPLEYQQIRLDASVSNQTHTIYWFIDGALHYSGPPGEPVFYKPTRGKHTLLCMDDEGRSTTIHITVE